MNSFEDEVRQRIRAQGDDKLLGETSDAFMRQSIQGRYSYNFSWMGRPIIQYPQDMVAMQEILWRLQPDLVIETGIAHGGSLVFYASILELIGKGRVLGIDIDIRAHNRAAIEAHPMARRIDMIQGSSIDPKVVADVSRRANGLRTLVVLDSNHTHDHVLAELRAYAPLVSVGSYCVVFDTVVEHLPAGLYPDRPWDVGNNPKTAVNAYLAENADFEVDDDREAQLLITVAPGGYLRRAR
ncbi:cephalosporin hydroxylase family protein [Arenimonas aestuarii]